MMNKDLEKLIEAERKAEQLFERIKNEKIIQSGKTENKINSEIYQLATKEFGIEKFWHKRIVRSGKNTLLPYKENPPDLTLKDDDILFLDFGPVFEEWEADFGRTYVIGNDRKKIKLMNDVETAWHEGKEFYLSNIENLTGADFYQFTVKLATKYGWKFGNEHCGHLVGKFPHEKLSGENKTNYLHPENSILLNYPDRRGEKRYWIYEIHFIDEEQQIGGFFEQLLF